jgi:hypothetical protein
VPLQRVAKVALVFLTGNATVLGVRVVVVRAFEELQHLLVELFLMQLQQKLWNHSAGEAGENFEERPRRPTSASDRTTSVCLSTSSPTVPRVAFLTCPLLQSGKGVQQVTMEGVCVARKDNL